MATKVPLATQEIATLITALEYFDNDLNCNPDLSFPDWGEVERKEVAQTVSSLLPKLRLILAKMGLGLCRYPL